VGTSLFSRGTAVEATGPGRYVGDLGECWNCPIVPQGGIVAATAARAMAAALGNPEQPLRSLNSVFAGQVRHGPIEVEVTVLRRGRSVSQVRATLRNPGAEAGYDALAVFGAEREGFSFTDRRVPDGVLPAMECPSYRDDPPEDFVPDRPWFTFWENVEGRPTIGHAPWEDYEPETSLRAQYYRFDDPPRTDDGAWDPLAVVALCDTMPARSANASARKVGAAPGCHRAPTSRCTSWVRPAASGSSRSIGPDMQVRAMPRPSSRCGTSNPARPGSLPTPRR
jgi:hypothetical protein